MADPRPVSPARSGAPSAESGTPDRAPLLEQHAAARRRRDGAALGSEEFRAAAEDVARIEIEIARLEEPTAQAPD